MCSSVQKRMAINIEYKSFYNYIQLTIFTQIPVEPLLLIWSTNCTELAILLFDGRLFMGIFGNDGENDSIVNDPIEITCYYINPL